MTEARMHSLGFVLAHRQEILLLCDRGRETPSGVAAKDWEKLWTVSDQSVRQAEGLLNATLDGVSSTLRDAKLRFERVTRAQTMVEKWEAWGRVSSGRSRSPLGLMGASLGVDARKLTSLSVWWGFVRNRRLAGPRLAELLRNTTLSVRVGSDRDGWVAGTVVLAELELAIPRTVDECASTGRVAAELISRHTDALRGL